MGALPPVSPWTPEDDLLLKKSVEDGASLESLAKGAVQFSRRFTVRELQERWCSLLYDPDISTMASERMIEVIELERSTSNLTSNKSSRVETSKECKEGQKRMVDSVSVRRRYYAMRKRIRSDPLNRSDLNFLVPPVEDCYGHSNILQDPMGSHFDVGNTNFDGMHHVSPEDIRNNTVGPSHKFDLRDKGQLENHPTEQGNECEEIPQVVHRNMSLGGNSTTVGGIDSSKEVLVQNPFKDNMDMNPMRISDDNNHSNMYPGLEGSHVFNSPVSDCEASFHHLRYSSPLPALPVWRNMDSTSAMKMGGDSHLRGENPQIGDPFGMPDEARKSSSKYDVMHSETDFQSHIVCDEMETSTSCPQFDHVALSDTPWDLSDNEMLLMDDDGKEIDKYGFFLDSPADVNEDQMLNVTQVDAAVAPEADVHICSSASSGHLDKGENDLSSSGLISVLEEQKPSSASDLNPQLNELCNGVICCTLNTENREVPCNEHVIFPSKSCFASLRRGYSEVSCRDLSIKDNLHKQASESGFSLVNRELKRFGELHADSQARGNRMGLNRAGERDAKLELPRSESFSANPRHPGADSSSTVVLKTVSTEIVSIKQSCPQIPNLPLKSSDGLKRHFEIGALTKKQEGQVLPATKKLEVNTQSETADEMAPEGVVDPFLSDVEEQRFEDDDADIPYFSDIESMILDMDLGPEDPDLYSSRQVAIYQSEDAKRAIIRLEQGAHACIQRAIASHGAFAVLYGRHSKHYIKKPEVLIGRATEDVFVDIDLGKEGRANKISRRQAIIKMDEDGVFHVRNLGKCQILVDNKEVYPGQSSILHSNCLIEVREMHFIFEQNQARVKQYLDATQMKQGLLPLM